MTGLCTHDMMCVYPEKRGEPMGIKKGTKLTDNPKDIQLKIRADKQTIEDLEYCCEKTKLSKSDVIRLGIKKVKEEVEPK